jgi:hypothetical protein
VGTAKTHAVQRAALSPRTAGHLSCPLPDAGGQHACDRIAEPTVGLLLRVNRWTAVDVLNEVDDVSAQPV